MGTTNTVTCSVDYYKILSSLISEGGQRVDSEGIRGGLCDQRVILWAPHGQFKTGVE